MQSFRCPTYTKFGIEHDSEVQSASRLSATRSPIGADHCNGRGRHTLPSDTMSDRMKEIFTSMDKPGDSGNPAEPPVWLNLQLFNRGRAFYRNYLFCIFFSNVLALIMLFSINRLLRPLIYTGRSDTPLRALRRYVSTILHILTWSSGDVWDPQDKSHADVLHVRYIHNRSAESFNSSKGSEKLKTFNVIDKGHKEPKCPMNVFIRCDLQGQTRSPLPLESEDKLTLYISQWDMVLTQHAFMGLIVTHPKKMGAWWATEEDLEGMIHFWRGIGWLLGIEDKYNFCSGNLKETQNLCKEIEKQVLLPGLSQVTWDYEHMAQSLVGGVNNMVPGLSFPAMFRFLADTLGVSVPTFVRHMSTRHTFQYWLMRLVFGVWFLIPGVVFLFNHLLLLALRVIQGESLSWLPNLKLSTVKPMKYQ